MIRISTFVEATLRIFVPSDSMAHAIDAVKRGAADGLCVDLCDDFGDVLVSHEVMPGRALTSWYGYECHGN